jgi:hypothetical protein
MADNVSTLRGGPIVQSDKRTMVDAIAQVFDEMAEKSAEPVCMVFALVGKDGEARTGYVTSNLVGQQNVLHISRGVACINCDYHHWDRDTQI